MRNAHYIYSELKKAGYSVSGGVNAPYILAENTGSDVLLGVF